MMNGSEATVHDKDTFELWDQFWFSTRDPYCLSVLRILVGGMILYTHCVWGLRLEEFFGNDGWNSVKLVQEVQGSPYAISIFWMIPIEFLRIVHWIGLGVVALYTLGLGTRVTSVLTWILAVSYANRAPLAGFGLDQINCILACYLMLSPCGSYLSVDRYLKRWWLNREDPIQPTLMTNVATRLIQVHMCVIYFFAGLSKLQGEAWWDGMAMWQAVSNYEYQSYDLTFLANYPFVLHTLTHITILWEITFAATVWRPKLRPMILTAGLAMHFGIGAFLGMWTFGTAMTFGYLAFLQPATVKHWTTFFMRRRDYTDSQSNPSLEGKDEFIEENINDEKKVRLTSDPLSNQPSQDVQREMHAELPSEVIAAGSIAKVVESEAGEVADESLKRAIEPDLILVARSASLRKTVFQYFGRYSEKCSLVAGFIEAGELASILHAPIIIDIDSLMTEAELNIMMQCIRARCSRVRFVVVGQTAEFAKSHSDVEVVERGCSVRQIRLAIEKLSGYVFEKREREPSTNIDKAGLLALLLAFFLGCSPAADTTGVMIERARMLSDRHRTDEALNMLDSILAKEPKNAEAHYLKGVAFEQQADLSKAKSAYDACLTSSPNYATALNNRGVVHGKLGDMEAAVEDLAKAVEIDPQDAVAWSNLGLAQHDLHLYQDALQSYNNAFEVKKEPRFLVQRANVLLDADRLAEADESYTSALKLDPQNASAYINRASARYRLGRSEEAKEDLKQAEKFDSDFSLAPLIKNLTRALEQNDSQPDFIAMSKRYLEGKGWIATDTQPPFPLTLKKDPDVVRNVVVLQKDARGNCTCDSQLAEAITSSQQPLILLIVSSVKPANSSSEDEPNDWIVYEDEAWKPSAEEFVPHLVKLGKIPVR